MQVPELGKQFGVARRSGTLNLSNRALSVFPPQLCGFNSLPIENEKWWDLVPLRSIDLSFNSIAVIPDAFADTLSDICLMNFCSNQLPRLPDALFVASARTLKSLNISSNSFAQLSDCIGQLQVLVELNLSNNRLISLPDSLCQLKFLEVLNLTKNRLEILPPDIGSLSSLSKLNITSNQLHALPVSFGRLTRLTLLEAAQNHLSEVPPQALESLCGLTYIDLRDNAIASLPRLPQNGALDQLLCGNNELVTLSDCGLEACLRLTVLELRDNKLQQIPAFVAQFKGLKVLDVSNNDLNDLPCELGTLASLRSIVVSGNVLRKIRRAIIEQGGEAIKLFLRSRLPDAVSTEVVTSADSASNRGGGGIEETVRKARYSIEQSHGLLSLAQCQPPLKQIPEIVFRDGTPWLQLDFSENQINLITPSIASVSRSIIKLSLDHNLLSEFQNDTIDTLTQLREFSLAYNSLRAVPDCWARLSCLSTLDLSHNPISEFPSVVLNLPALTVLNLSFCKLSGTLPDLSLSRLLESVNVADNKIVELEQADLRCLPALHYFNVENNELKALPIEFGVCSHLKALLVSGNPLRSVPFAIMQKGTPALLAYLLSKIPLTSPLLCPLPAVVTVKPTVEVIEETVVRRQAVPVQVFSSRGATSCATTSRVEIPVVTSSVVSEKKSAASTATDSVLDMAVRANSLDNQITDINKQLESFGVSATKMANLRRQLQTLRAERNRLPQ